MWNTCWASMALVSFFMRVTGVFLCVKGFACFPLYALSLWSFPLLLGGLLFALTDLCTWISAAGKSQKHQKSVRSGGLRIEWERHRRGQRASEKTSVLLLCPLETHHQMVGWRCNCTSKECIGFPQRGTFSTITRLSIVEFKWRFFLPMWDIHNVENGSPAVTKWLLVWK